MSTISLLALKVLITSAADWHFFFFFQRKIRLDISCELSARQMIHMKCHVIFSLNLKKKKKMSSVTFYLAL